MRSSFRPKLEPLEGRVVPALTHTEVHVLINEKEVQAPQIRADLSQDLHELAAVQATGLHSPNALRVDAALRADISADETDLLRVRLQFIRLSQLDAVEDNELSLSGQIRLATSEVASLERMHPVPQGAVVREEAIIARDQTQLQALEPLDAAFQQLVAESFA